MKLPPISKKIYSILVILVLAIGIIIGGILVLKSQSGQAENSLTEKISDFFQQGFQLEQSDAKDDFDNDGLSDQDEKLLGTDWRNPDTDGDGYLDGEEISSGYDPLRPAPGDELKEGEAIKPRPLPKNLTLALSQALSKTVDQGGLTPFEGPGGQPDFLDAGQVDLNINEELAHAFSATAREFALEEIEENEITIFNDNSPEAVKAFSASVMEALAQAAKSAQRKDKTNISELEAIIQAIQTRDFFSLDIYIEGFDKGYQAVKTIPVPADWKEIHKKHLSILLAHSKILKAVREIGTDPIRATIALQQYQSIIDATLALTRESLKLIDQE